MDDTQDAPDAYDDPYSDPLQYLNRVARCLTGWSVARQFKTNVPRVAREVEKSGPRAAALYACGRSFRLYGIGLLLLAALINAFALTVISYPLFGLAGICALCELACAASARKPQREYRHAREARRE